MQQSKTLRALVLVLIALIIGVLFWFTKLYSVDSDMEAASYNWTVTVHDKTYENVDLSTLSFPNATVGDELDLVTTINTSHVIASPQLFLFTDHAAIEIFLDGEKIYTEGMTDYRLGNLVPCGNQWIDLPEDYNGKELEIRMYVNELDAFSNVQQIYVVDGTTAKAGFAYEYRIPLILNSFLLILGIVLAIAITLMMNLTEDWLSLLCLAGFSVCVALWSLSNTNLLLLFINDLRARVSIEYTSLYLEPLLFILYFHSSVKKTGIRAYSTVYHCLTGIQGLFVIVAITGQMTGKLRYPTLLPVQHVILVGMFVFMTIFIIHCIRAKEQISKILLFGMACILASGVFDLVMYNLKKFFSVVSQVRFRGIFSLGTMIFVICLVLDYIFRMMDAVRAKSKAEMYEQMAYTDSLTGLDNRRRLEEVFDDVDRLGENFCVVSMDLNWLKRINDTMGHDVGDEYLKSFAVILRESFQGAGSVFRVGGDEFAAVLRGNGNAEQIVTIVNAKIAKLNTVHWNWNMSVAAGAVASSENPGLSIREAYRLADERMYANKKEMKAVRED